MLDLNDLRLFVHIVDHQGILRAGRALQLPNAKRPMKQPRPISKPGRNFMRDSEHVQSKFFGRYSPGLNPVFKRDIIFSPIVGGVCIGRGHSSAALVCNTGRGVDGVQTCKSAGRAR